MNRAQLFGLLMLWLLLITFILNSFIEYNSELGLTISGNIDTFSGSTDDSNWTNTISLMRTFWGALTFSIQGLPVIFNLLFQIPTFMIGFMTLQMIRGN